MACTTAPDPEVGGKTWIGGNDRSEFAHRHALYVLLQAKDRIRALMAQGVDLFRDLRGRERLLLGRSHGGRIVAHLPQGDLGWRWISMKSR
jgi:hypothetical protein